MQIFRAVFLCKKRNFTNICLFLKKVTCLLKKHKKSTSTISLWIFHYLCTASGTCNREMYLSHIIWGMFTKGGRKEGIPMKADMTFEEWLERQLFLMNYESVLI